MLTLGPVDLFPAVTWTAAHGNRPGAPIVVLTHVSEPAVRAGRRWHHRVPWRRRGGRRCRAWIHRQDVGSRVSRPLLAAADRSTGHSAPGLLRPRGVPRARELRHLSPRTTRRLEDDTAREEHGARHHGPVDRSAERRSGVRPALPGLPRPPRGAATRAPHDLRRKAHEPGDRLRGLSRPRAPAVRSAAPRTLHDGVIAEPEDSA
jgi:hypothetical protein